MSRSYCYGSLLPGVIRLLRLFPNEDKSALLQCQLFDYSLQGSDTRTHPYDALSYVWGGSEKPEAIYISEYTLPVTANLHEALLRLRHHSIERIIWVDAICIDQGNDREKEQQIQIMAKIYAQANRVVVLLGEAADDSSLVLETIRSVGYKKSIDYSGDQKIRKSILALLQRPWFRRIWVLQEVAAARYVLVVCGPTEVDGYAFCLGLNSLTKFYKEHADMQILAHPITSLINEAIFRPSYGSSNSGRVSLDICPLGELIDRYHTHEATRHHDKLYALLGMCSDNISEPLLSPNYRNSWKDVLRSLVKFLLGENISIEIWDDKDITIIESKGY
ncbi:heterokaryon incompatibility protein-domain-containing protein, partial [Xylogone sp. PMI_703]